MIVLKRRLANVYSYNSVATAEAAGVETNGTCNHGWYDTLWLTRLGSMSNSNVVLPHKTD